LTRPFYRLSNGNTWTSSTNAIAAPTAGLTDSKHPENDIENAHHSFKSGGIENTDGEGHAGWNSFHPSDLLFLVEPPIFSF